MQEVEMSESVAHDLNEFFQQVADFMRNQPE
jgi:hypothetical protein